jgi:hypothetical protein
MKSFALLRTNVSLTTNYKIMVDSKYELFFDSIDSKPELNTKELKRVRINKENGLEYTLPNYWSKTPHELAFHIKDDEDVDIMYSEFSNQYDTIYHCGGRNISNNKDYTEEFEYFAPLHITKGYLPKFFVIFRIDGPGLLKLTKDSFRQEILDKMKCVRVFDMTRSTDLGVFLSNSINLNTNFPNSTCDIDYEDLHSTITGIKYPVRGTDSGFVEQHFFCDFRKELTFYDLQKFITERFKNDQVIYPNILNLSFLFDDTPATPSSLRKWSLNRYMGFYFDDMELTLTVSPTKLFSLKSDVFIDGDNFLVSKSMGSPFLNELLIDKNNLFINVNRKIYKIFESVDLNTIEKVRTNLNSNTFSDQFNRIEIKKYKVISDEKLSKYTLDTSSILNNVFIKYENEENRIYMGDGVTPFIIENFEDSDMWMIKISDEYFKLTKNINNIIIINTDYAFEQKENTLEYYINDPDPKFRKSFDISLKSSNEPLKFFIYRCRFTDIKDFDNDFIETEYSKFEYETDDGLTITDESKLYVQNKRTNGVDDFKFGSDVVNIPVSSEYTSNDETFRIYKLSNTELKLNGLWKKNPNFIKWGYKGSLCSNHYPYLLNNSFQSDPFNRSTNYLEPIPKRVEKNLDYFFTINSDGGDYRHQSLHIERRINNVTDKNFKFELDKYLGIGTYSLDYFTYFFGIEDELSGGSVKKNIKKWSYFNGGPYETNTTVFKGLKLMMLDVIDANNLSQISVTNTQNFTDYKFSILLSKNDYGVTINQGDPNLAVVERKFNSLKWIMLEQWKSNKSYEMDSLVLWNDIIYRSKSNVTTTLPLTPGLDTDKWEIYSEQMVIFLRPGSVPFLDPPFGGVKLVYNSGEYYFFDDDGTRGDFWIEGSTYDSGIIVLFKSKFFKSLINGNNYSPKNIKYWGEYLPNGKEAMEFKDSRIWKSVPEWKSGSKYDENNLVTYKNVVYGTRSEIINSVLNPSSDPLWIRIHSFVADSQTNYGITIFNNTVRINEQMYLCVDNSGPPGANFDSTLDDGINVYINKKFKNILVNIYVNDNTLSKAKKNLGQWEIIEDKISNINRDALYEDTLYKFTASNFFNLLQMPDKSLGFIDKMRYIIINEDSSLNIYDFNHPESAQKLPHILRSHFSNKIPVGIDQIDSKIVEVDQNVLKPNLILDDGSVTTKGALNFYSNMPLANTIDYKDSMTKPTLQTLTPKQIFLFRHNGSYAPIFREIQLFKSNLINKDYNNFKFDTELTDFGMTSEQVISKVNRNGSQLKLRNSTKFNSIYPMLDEIGYNVVKRFIFKSSWDFNYYFECFPVSKTDVNIRVNNVIGQNDTLIGQDKILTIRKCN